jgi:hypothetical protein
MHDVHRPFIDHLTKAPPAAPTVELVPCGLQQPVCACQALLVVGTPLSLTESRLTEVCHSISPEEGGLQQQQQQQQQNSSSNSIVMQLSLARGGVS